MEIRRLLSEIEKELLKNKHDKKSVYNLLNYIVIKLEDKYNLQEEEIEKNLKMILESLNN